MTSVWERARNDTGVEKGVARARQVATRVKNGGRQVIIADPEAKPRSADSMTGTSRSSEGTRL